MIIENWLLFSSIALVATLSPGPAVLLVTTHSLQFGPGRTVITILGNITGLLVMSALSVLGLSAVIMHSALAFTVIKTIGALYLIYLGIKLWRSGIQTASPDQASLGKLGLLKMYLQGLTVALTNPKAIVFTTALFPQFIDPAAALIPQFSLLVLTFMAFSFICLLGYAFATHKASGYAKQSITGKSVGRWFGGTFIGAGLLLAASAKS